MVLISECTEESASQTLKKRCKDYKTLTDLRSDLQVSIQPWRKNFKNFFADNKRKVSQREKDYKKKVWKLIVLLFSSQNLEQNFLEQSNLYEKTLWKKAVFLNLDSV